MRKTKLYPSELPKKPLGPSPRSWDKNTTCKVCAGKAPYEFIAAIYFAPNKNGAKKLVRQFHLDLCESCINNQLFINLAEGL